MNRDVSSHNADVGRLHLPEAQNFQAGTFDEFSELLVEDAKLRAICDDISARASWSYAAKRRYVTWLALWRHARAFVTFPPKLQRRQMRLIINGSDFCLIFKRSTNRLRLSAVNRTLSSDWLYLCMWTCLHWRKRKWASGRHLIWPTRVKCLCKLCTWIFLHVTGTSHCQAKFQMRRCSFFSFIRKY